MKPEPRRLARALAPAALALLASASAVLAQTVAPPAPAPTPPAAAPTPALVRLGLTVVDEKNRMAGDLKREDVRLFEDGVERSVGYFERETAPVSYGLVVDNSGSARKRLDQLIAASAFVVGRNRPGDETFVLRFVGRERIQIVQDMTSDTAAVRMALDDLYVEGGQTAVIDALYLAAEYMTKKSRPSGDEPRRRSLVLVSDGEDRASYYKLDQLLALLREGDIQVFCVGFVADLDAQRGSHNGGRSGRGKAESLMRRLAAETGGRVFFVKSAGELQEASEEIVKNLHTQYVVGYSPAAGPAANSPGKLEIKLAETQGKGKRTAVHKPGGAGAGQGEVKKKGD